MEIMIENASATNSPISISIASMFLTIISGVIVYISGQYIQNFVLVPLQNFKLVLVDLNHKLKFHSNYLCNPDLIKGQKYDHISGDMRDLSCNLESKYIIIPFKQIMRITKQIPKPEDVNDAASRLIRLSNNLRHGEGLKNHDDIEHIKQVLQLTIK